MKYRSFLPLVCLDEGANYYGVVLGVCLLRLVGRSGGGEGVGGALGLSHQVLMGLMVLFLGQLRGMAGCRSLGVSRCRGLGVVEAGSEVRHRDFAHLDSQIRGHLWAWARDYSKSKGSHRESGRRIQACWGSGRAVERRGWGSLVDAGGDHGPSVGLGTASGPSGDGRR